MSKSDGSHLKEVLLCLLELPVIFENVARCSSTMYTLHKILNNQQKLEWRILALMIYVCPFGLDNRSRSNLLQGRAKATNLAGQPFCNATRQGRIPSTKILTVISTDVSNITGDILASARTRITVCLRFINVQPVMLPRAKQCL